MGDFKIWCAKRNLSKVNRVFVAAALIVSTVMAAPSNAKPEMAETYIVKFRSVAILGNEVSQLKSKGIQVRQELTDVFPGAILDLTPNQLAVLSRNPNVEFAEKDAPVSTDATQYSVTWGIDRIDQVSNPLDTKYSYVSEGAGVTVYIIDTGIRITHNEFKSGANSRATWGANFQDKNNSDCNGHGTHVAGTIGGNTYGVAKKVSLVAVKVLGCSGSGTTSGVIAGINWVIQDHVAKKNRAVANMSLGAGLSSAVNDAIASLTNSGVAVAVAAGNSNADACNFSPASSPSAITVGATDRSDVRASFSNFGKCLDVFAPGVAITSSWNSSNSSINTISGTSMASPHVAGVLARMISTVEFTAQSQCFSSCSTFISSLASTLISDASKNFVSQVNGSPNLLLYRAPLS